LLQRRGKFGSRIWSFAPVGRLIFFRGCNNLFQCEGQLSLERGTICFRERVNSLQGEGQFVQVKWRVSFREIDIEIDIEIEING